MEAFNALWDNPEQRKRPSNNDFQLFTAEEWISHSSTYRILSGTFTCPLPPGIACAGLSSSAKKSTVRVKTLQETVQQTKNGQAESSQKLREYIPGLVKLPSLTRMSSLSHEEHHDCLSLLQKFDGRDLNSLTVTERAEYQLFVSLYNRVKEEQKEFIEFAKSHWQEFIDRVSKLKRDPLHFIYQLWMAQVRCALARYPKNFQKYKNVSLAFKGRPAVKLCFVKNLLNIGRIPLVKLPEFDKPFRVATRSTRLRAWGFLNVHEKQTAGTLHRVPVSGDPNSERLAHLNGAQVVISSSGLKCLLDLHEDSKETNVLISNKHWRLPVFIKEYRTFENGVPTTKKVVFIDKALPPNGMTGPEKVLKYHKHALLAALVHRYSEGKELDIKGEEFCHVKEDNLKPETLSSSLTASENELCLTNASVPSSTSGQKELAESVSSSQHDEFGDVSITPHNSNLSHSSSAESDDSDDESKLVMDVDEELADMKSRIACSETDSSIFPSLDLETSENLIVETNLEPSPAVVNCKKEKLTEKISTHLKSKSTIPNSEHEPLSQAFKANDFVTEPSNQTPPVKVVNGHALPLNVTNLVYNLWTLQQENTSSNPIKLLIRNHVQGCVSLGNHSYQDICLACKPEFQLEFGAEAISLSELSRQWIDLLLHPEAILARVRVNVVSSEMVKLEKRSLLEIQNEAHVLHGVDVGATLPALHSAFSDLLSFPCGQYLLCRNPNVTEEADLLISTQNHELACLDLSLEYRKSPACIPCDVPWQPLDTSVVLPRNNFFNSMPCTFVARNKKLAVPKRTVPMRRERNVTKLQSKKRKKRKKKKANK